MYVNGHCGEKVSHILEISGAVGGEMASADETISFTSQQKSMVVGIFGVVFEETQIYNNGKMTSFQKNWQKMMFLLLLKEHNATIR